MKKLILILLGSLLATSAAAQVTIVKIHEAGTLSDDFMTLFLDSGEIVHVPKDDLGLVSLVRKNFASGESVQLTKISADESRPDLVVAMEAAAQPSLREKTIQKEMYSPEGQRAAGLMTTDPLEKANITTLASYEDAQAIMNGLRSDTGDYSQCYNRAHVWTYETLVNSGTTLGKSWIFFTKKYIREYTYKWWFHIAPYTKVNDANQTYVLDRGFTMIPYNLVNWKNIFMKNQADCPVIQNYQDYEDHQDTADCYLMFSSQYYWQPHQLKKLSTTGAHTWGYRRANLEIAYAEAIVDWDRIVPVLAGSYESREVPPVPRPEPRVETNPYYSALSVRFLRGAEVIDESYQTGEIVRILGPNEALIEYDRYNGTVSRPISGLGLRVNAFLSFRRGTEILDENRNRGEIRQLYSNGVALIDYDNYGDGHIRLSKRIGYEVRQLGNVRKGQSAIDSAGNTGEVERLYSNGFIVFDRDGTSADYVIPVTDLLAEVRELRGFRPGARVIYGTTMGRVRRVFAGGQVFVDFDSYYSDGIVRIEQLALEVSTVQGFARGNRVLFRGSYRARIEKLYSDGRAFVSFDDRVYADGLVSVAELQRVR